MQGFSQRMFTKHRRLYRALTSHPLVTGLAGGTLPAQVYRAYLIQDYLYLQRFSECLRVLAERSHRQTERAMLRRHWRESVAAEVALHESFFTPLGISAATLEAAEPLPACASYAQALRETAQSAPLSNALAALLPCYRAYLEMGKKVASRKPANPLYSQWAALYSGPEYERAVLEIERAADARATAHTAAEMERLYVRSCRREADFLDAVYGCAAHTGANKP